MTSQEYLKSLLPVDNTKEHVDHRKRRRNRTTLSCLNCHGSKRMCDRKRPACGRCTKLGLSGTCVYEVDDLNRRDASHGEVLLLKNRIAELEGFIREYKKKPHPRTVVRRNRADSTASFVSCSKSGADVDSSAEGRSASPRRSLTISHRESSPESDNDPRTPSVQEEAPIFIKGTLSSDIVSSPTSDQPVDQSRCSGPTQSDRSNAMGIDSAFDFRRDESFSEDNETLDRVFARIMEQGLQEASPSRNCGCVKTSSAYSAILELGPHLRRALNALHCVPKHSEFGSPCYLLNELQSLNDAVFSIIETSSGAAVSPASSYIPQVQQPQDSLTPSSSTVPAASPEDSPLQRVLARRARLVQSPLSTAQTPTAANMKRTLRGSTVQPTWEANQTTTGSAPVGSENDSFMSWESPSRGTWPRTISL